MYSMHRIVIMEQVMVRQNKGNEKGMKKQPQTWCASEQFADFCTQNEYIHVYWVDIVTVTNVVLKQNNA